jgi:hypothetical protein
MPPSKYSQHLPSALNISFECIDELEDEGGLVDLDSLGSEDKPDMPARGGTGPFSSEPARQRAAPGSGRRRLTVHIAPREALFL